MKMTLKHRVYTHEDGTQTDIYDADIDDAAMTWFVHGFKLDYNMWRPIGSELEFVLKQMIRDPEHPNSYKIDENLKPLSVDIHKNVKSVTIEWE